MTTQRKVAVNVKCAIFKHPQDGVFAARLPELGLTGYGATNEEAIISCKRLFNRFIHAYRDVGKLEDVLNRAGVRWSWADESPAKSEYEDTNRLSSERDSAVSPAPSRESAISLVMKSRNLQVWDSASGIARDSDLLVAA